MKTEDIEDLMKEISKLHEFVAEKTDYISWRLRQYWAELKKEQEMNK